MKNKIILSVLTFSFVLSPVLALGVNLPRPEAEVHINTKGVVSLKNAVVFYIIGNTLFARTNWGDAYIQWSLRPSQKIQIYKRFGGLASVSDIKVGHILDVEGQILLGSRGLDLIVSKITDKTLENEDGNFSGTVISVDGVGNIFTLKLKSGSEITVSLDQNATIKKGVLVYPRNKIKVNDKVLSVRGIYHKPTRTLKATHMELGVDYSVFKARNFQGTLKSVSSTTLPSSIVVRVQGKDYTVHLTKESIILTKWRFKTSLQRYLVGDTVRFYGAIRNTVDENEVDASVLRNLNL